MKLIEASSATVDQMEADQEKSDACCSPVSMPHPSCSFTPSPSSPNCPLIGRPVFSSASSSCSNSVLRQCRICLLDTDTRCRPLITPCRCAGSVQHVHRHCLAHWIEVSSRKSSAVPRCELCGYRYRRNAFIDLAHLHFPFMELSDKVLNTICVLLLIIMTICAWVAIYHLSVVEQQRIAMASVAAVGNRLSVSSVHTSVSSSSSSASASSNSASAARTITLSEQHQQQTDLSELIGKTDQKFLLLIAAAVLFFCAFFLALFTQYRAEVTVFRAITRFWATNRNWRIRNYSPSMDTTTQQRRRRRAVQQQPQRRLIGGVVVAAAAATTTMMTDSSDNDATAADRQRVPNLDHVEAGNQSANQPAILASSPVVVVAVDDLMLSGK
ncbi:hypothetical protein niasHT_017198 [Heterodera trifolii]|uniref:RING-CH-type domain-containing protein n=1 Tax=Heterodera trifolii TaxID=157864 RepID=A0ABD2LD98_9BILA